MSTQTLTQRRVAEPVSAPTKAIVSKGGVTVNRVPATKPNFTIGDIRKAIPTHCFSRPLTKSFGYLFWDLFIVAVLIYATSFIELIKEETFGAALAPVLRHVLWVTYWVCQGCVMTGEWR
jgi:omega-6 fatty acid desaturase (delta-12 desaturase)